MDELKEIIVHKLKFIADYRTKIEDGTKEDYVEQLLKEKKKENSRQVIESRLLQTLVARKVQAPYRLQQFLGDSQKWMKIYDPSFQFHQSTKNDIFMNITNIYVSFFQRQKCQRRAQQLKHIYEKKLCEKSFLIPTIFNWFVEWVRKTFNNFIKNNLARLNESSNNIKKVNDKKAKKLNLEKWIDQHRKSIKNLEVQLKNYQNSSGICIKKSELLSPTSSNVLKSKRSLSMPFESNLDKDLQQKQKVISPTKQLTSNTKEDPIFIGLNRQIFYASYGQQLNTYYKYIGQVLPDIDLSYLKTHRRNDKRTQIKNKIEELAKSLARGQTQIKRSIEEYSQQYSRKISRKKTLVKQKQQTMNKSSPMKKVRSKSRVSQELQKIGQQEEFQKSEKKGDKKKDLIKDRKSKSLNPRHELQKKNALLQLPDINKHNTLKNENKKLRRVLFASSNRYAGIVSLEPEQPSKQQMKKYNTSRQRTISQLKEQDFHNSSHNSIRKFKAARMGRSINKSLLQKSNEIMLQQAIHNNLYQQQQQKEDDDGVFYLPKIRT